MSKAVRLNVASSWVTDSGPMRACVVCDHGRAAETVPNEFGAACFCPDLGGPLPSELMRSNDGGCGPEAAFLTIKGNRL